MGDCKMNRLAKAIRSVTLAPVMAGIMLTLVYVTKPQVMGRVNSFWWGIFFLTVLPILAYPLQPYIPGYREKGREGQRGLAMVFAVAGYLMGVIANFVLKAPRGMWMIYLEYLLSGLLILLFNKCLGLRASGHACGVAGPAALLVYFRIPALIPGLIILALTWWASLRMKRHTAGQLLGGMAIPVAVILVLTLLEKITL